MSTDARSAVVECHAQAVRQYNTGRPAQSLRTLQRALKLLDRAHEIQGPERDTLAARIWISRALSEVEIGQVTAGIEALLRAEEFAQRSRAPKVIVLLYTQRGAVFLRRGDLAAARASFDEAARLIDHVEARDQASLLLNRGVVNMLDNRLAAARADLERAASVAGSGALSVERFKALHNLAYLEFLAGDLPRALRLMDEAAEIDADVSRGVWLMDRARVLVDAGLAREADDSLRQAADILRAARLTHDFAEATLERARCALAMDDVGGARRLAAQARALFRRRSNERWRRAAELVLLQAQVAAAGRPARSVGEDARRLRDELRDEGLPLPARIAALVAVEARLAAGDTPGAANELASVEPARPDDPITGRLYSRYVHARVAAASGEPVTAAQVARRGLQELTDYQASFGSIDLRTASAVHGRRLAELDVDLALAASRPAALFAAVERARAVSSRLPAVRPPGDPVAADLLAELRQTVESLRAVEQDPAASEPLLRRRRDLEKQIVARSWTRSGSGGPLRPAGFAVVRAELSTLQATMITYVQTSGRLTALVVGPRPALHDLGPLAPIVEYVRRVRADLDVLAQPRLPGGILAAVRASLHRSLAALDDALLAPAMAGGPVVIVSTGLLGQLPWASLPSLRGRPIVVAPSATKWLHSAQAEAHGSGLVVSFAGPDLDRGEDEALGVEKAWPGAHVVTGADATAEAFKEAVGSASVLHVAAHGVHQPENPLFSCLRMADGPVFAHELDQTHSAPEHVVLSACEVGLATIRPGDEALGLASVLLQLGTRSVIASVARVGDEVAEQTMAEYHRRLAGGASSAEALAEALVEVDADVTPPFVNFGAAWHATDLEPARTLA